MKNFIEFFKNNSYTAPALVVAAAVILSTLIFNSGILSFANKSDSITVTGTAERMVKSDTAKWSITLSSRMMGDNALQSGNKEIAVNYTKLEKYLLRSGITQDQIEKNPTTANDICQISAQGYGNCDLGVIGKNVFQNITIETDNVDLVENMSNKINSELSDVQFTQNVEYYFNGLKDIRVEMLAEATKNARERADSVADAGGASVGNITSLSSGVFQLTAKNSVSFDDYGAYDLTSVEKKVTATVKANFSVK